MSLTTMVPVIDGRFRLGDRITKGEPTCVDGDEISGTGAGLAPLNDRSSVFRAEDLTTGKSVAVKVLIQASSKSPGFRLRFQRDAEILCTLDHPNVVRTIAAGLTSEGQPYLAMELLEGRTLAEILAEDGVVAPEEMAKYLPQIALALDAAHSKGIVHREINPGAIMIHEGPDGSPTVKLLDFGLGRDLEKPTPSQVELTSKQTSLGTAAYLSPEQARGGEIDGRSDVYALGVTLYESLTGYLPFEGETDFQILLAQINGSIPPFPEDWRDRANASAIEAVVVKALSKDPADRPATAGALSASFLEALHSRPARSFPVGWPVFAAAGVLITSLVALAKWLL